MAARRPVAPPPFGAGRTESADRAALLAAPVRWPRPDLAEAGLSSLPGIGKTLEARAAAAGVLSVGDLLWRVPRAYGDPPGRILLGELELGRPAAVAVEVLRSRRVRTRRRGLSVVEARVADSSGERKATWFNQPWMAEQLVPGRRFLLEGRLDTRGFTVSATEPIAGAEAVREDEGPDSGAGRDLADGGARAGTPVRWNSASAASPPGLAEEERRGRHSASGEIGPSRWRRWAFEACRVAAAMPEPVPATLLRERDYPGATAAVREAHFPAGEERAALALERLAWEELLLHQAVLRHRRESERSGGDPAVALAGPDEMTREWIRNLPFRLTGDQQKAAAAITAELAGETPMRRLLMGEVGSGKTVVALLAMLRTAESGAQAAFMAPTAVLAEQHARTVGRLLEGTGIRPALLTGDTPRAARDSMLRALASGDLDLIVGTHALLEDRVAFRRLALCVVDEEHRFGVRQRARLNAKAPRGRSAHLLHMTATPIPRTLSLTAYGDLDVTTLRELPPGRLPVRTELARETARSEVFEQVRKELDRGRQCFVVCPLIEESEQLEARAAAAEAERLAGNELEGYEVGLIHGRMTPAQKEVAMTAFADGRIDALVATTVIEVGIDVPNATVMVIEGAERFGLAQLHQLRGRIGRGRHGGTCFLLSGSDGLRARRRLAELAGESDGFRLAEIDLEMRGEGEITGTRQHGLPRFAVASLPRDTELLEAAREDLDRIEAGPEYDLLLRTAMARFGSEDEGSNGREPR